MQILARDLIVTQNTTLDAVIDASGDWFAPTGSEDPDEIAEMAAVEERLRASADALLVGRRTFEELRGWWPHQTDDPTGVAENLDRVDKYVVSHLHLGERVCGGCPPDWRHGGRRLGAA